jgi:lipopolysaccharide heptosyltransferase II
MNSIPRKILVVDLAFIGDLLMSTPALTCLRRAFPAAEIDMLVASGSRPVIERNPDINSISSSGVKRGGWGVIRDEAQRLSKERYDLAISLHRGHGTLMMLKLAGIPRRIGFTNGGRGIFLTGGIPFDLYRHRSWNALRLLEKALGIEVDYRTPTRLVLDPESVENIENLLRGLPQSAGIVAINPNAAWATKRWLPERFAQVADSLADKGLTPVLIGGSKEQHVAERVKTAVNHAPVDLTGKTTLDDLAALLARSRCLITNDSGPMHIAHAVSTPVVAIFGPTDPARCGPWLSPIEPLQASVDCAKCYRKTCWHLTCMREITAEAVLTTAQACIS